MIRKITLAFVLCLAPSLARAATIDFTSLGRAEVVSIGGVRTITAWAGELNWAWLNGQPEGATSTFFSYCVDVLSNETDTQGVTVVAVNSLASPTLKKAAWLFNTYADTVHATAGAAGNAMAAGLQLAIWEVMYDNTYNLASGSFYASASGAALSYGNSYRRCRTLHLSMDSREPDYSNCFRTWSWYVYGLCYGRQRMYNDKFCFCFLNGQRFSHCKSIFNLSGTDCNINRCRRNNVCLE